MKTILVSLAALALLAAPAMATTNQENIGDHGGFQGLTIYSPSMATNAIDTTTVLTAALPHIIESGIFAAADTAVTDLYEFWPIQIAFEGLSGTGGSGTVDSAKVAIDFSHDQTNWTQGLALTLHTNAAPVTSQFIKFHSNQAGAMKRAAPYLRVRLQNTGAATGTSVVTLRWRKQQ